jgi:serine/threonine protein kinase
MTSSLDQIKINDLVENKYQVQKILFKNNLNTGMPNFLAKGLDDSKNYLGYVQEIQKRELSDLKDTAYIWQEISKIDSCKAILSIVEHFTSEDKFYLFQSPPQGKTLKMTLQEKMAKDMLFSMEEVLNILLSILDSLCQLHANGIVHGEINSEYIFWNETEKRAMLLGLGFPFATHNILNKGGYSPPEQLNGKLQEQSDLYALGMLGLYLLTGISTDDFSEKNGHLDLTHAECAIFMPLFNWLKQAVELNIENRFKTALEMREKLEDFYEMIMGEKLPPITIHIINPPPPEKKKNFKDKYLYLFNGQEYGKGRLVLAVVTEYLKQNPQLTLQELQNIFPKSLQGSYEIIVELSVALEKFEESKYKRYFIDDDEILLDVNHVKMAVNSQWGSFNIGKFIDKARELDFTVEAVEPERTNSKYILRLRTKDNLDQILKDGKSPAWKVAESKESDIENVEVYNWDGTKVVKGIFDAKSSYREPDENGYLRLIVVFTNGSLEAVNPPLEWNGQNPVQYIEINPLMSLSEDNE